MMAPISIQSRRRPPRIAVRGASPAAVVSIDRARSPRRRGIGARILLRAQHLLAALALAVILMSTLAAVGVLTLLAARRAVVAVPAGLVLGTALMMPVAARSWSPAKATQAAPRGVPREAADLFDD